jgi:hypothetical protein
MLLGSIGRLGSRFAAFLIALGPNVAAGLKRPFGLVVFRHYGYLAHWQSNAPPH